MSVQLQDAIGASLDFTVPTRWCVKSRSAQVLDSRRRDPDCDGALFKRVGSTNGLGRVDFSLTFGVLETPADEGKGEF